MKWAIVYDDLSVVRGEGEEQWRAAPMNGVQFVVTEGGQTFSGHEYYFYTNGIIWPDDELGRLLERVGFIKAGRTTSDANFENARNIARQEERIIRGG